MFEPFTLDQMTIFLAVVDHGGFSAAAKQLGRVQSAVSHSVASLEKTLDAKLLDRRHRPPELTDAGRRLAVEARLVLAQARELRTVAGAMRAGLEPELNLAVDSLYPAVTLAQTLHAFHVEFPTVSLRVVTDLLGEAVRLVRDGEVDFGVCNVVDGHARDLTILPAGHVALVPVCSPHHPLADEPTPQRADLLERHVQVVLSERTLTSSDRGVLSERTWRVTDLEMKARLLAAGVGWGSLPVEVANPGIERGTFVRLHPEPWPKGGHRIDMHTVVRSDRPLGPAGTWLRQRMALAAPGPDAATPP